MAKKETAGDVLAQEVGALLRARNPIIILTTPEEARVQGVVAAVAASIKPPYGIKRWNCVQGVTDLLGKEDAPGKQAKAPGAVLAAIAESKKREVWILLDFHPFWKAPVENRALRNLALELPNSPTNESRTIVIITPSSDVPVEFQDHVVVVKWKLPDREEMAGVFDAFVDGLQDGLPAKKTPPEVREAAIDALMGLSVVQAQGVLSKSIVKRKGMIDPKMIGDAKKQIINAGSGIEYHDPDPRGLDAVGGLDVLKDWLRKRRHAFSEKAKAFGLKKPKAVLIVGQPGCGKSLTAKALAAGWGVPFLRLDLGAALGGIVGQSEKQLAACFAVIDAIGSCVVMIDEFEKMISTGESLDGGVGKRQLGAMLSWMEDRKGSAFIVATANDVHKLPAELLRQGRFDGIFFVDLPDRAERRAILKVSLAEVGRTEAGIDLDAVIQATEGFAGVEVASIVQSALFCAFEDKERALVTGDLLEVAKTVVPLSRTAAESVKARRDWARTRAISASLPEAVEEESAGGRALDVDDYGTPGSN